ncbi:hypothetical protein, partial [Guyparkeria sp.]|uniref:hypothetical protein n=1 Tax=Guyparkeria sp. TaxID=2035736 RepID=UPI003970A611
DAFNGERNETLAFDVLGYAELQDHTIGITVTTEDDGNGQRETAGAEISLTTDFNATGDGDSPAEILQWEAIDSFDPTEDTAFALDEAFAGQIQDGVTDNGVNVTINGLPDGTVVTGMTETVIDGETVYTASAQGGDTALQTLLSGITVTPPPDWNSNKGPFEYDAKLTTFVPSGNQNQQSVAASQSVQPVSDTPAIDITAPSVDEGQTLPITIDLSNPADSPNWTLVDNQIYLQLDEGTLPAGTLRDDAGQALATEAVSGVSGVPDGDYYVIPTDPTSQVSLIYEPGSETRAGNIGLTAYARGQEDNASNIETTTTTTETALEPVNNGYDVSVADASGAENPFAQAENDRSNVVRLNIDDGGLVDTDGSEAIGSVLLKDVPDGFLVFVGDHATSAEQAGLATNAGGNGTNTWLIGEGEIPDYIGIMPPRYWSGTVEDLTLVVNSGETSLSETEPTEARFNLEIDAVANGVTLSPTPSFGTEGDVIDLNLNHELADRKDAGAGDESTETITLEIDGLGEHAGLYVDGSLISGTDQVAYDVGTDTYTVTGLTSEDAEQLGFVQAANDIGSVQIRARSEESANQDQSDWTDWTEIEAKVESAFGTNGDDSLLWTGDLLDGRGGEDTIQLRFGEEITGEDVATNLANVEVIDMSGNGANAIASLRPEDVLDSTDEDNVLAIHGDSDDRLGLDTGWTEQSSGAPAGYTLYQGDVGGELVELRFANTITVE